MNGIHCSIFELLKQIYLVPLQISLWESHDMMLLPRYFSEYHGIYMVFHDKFYFSVSANIQ